MKSRLLHDMQNELDDEKSLTILSLKEKLVHEVCQFELDEIRLQQKISLCEEKINDAKQRKLECEAFILLDKDEEDLVKDLNEMDISKSVILFNENLANKCLLTPEEKKSWAVRSHALYGSLLNPVSYIRSFSVWSGADRYIRQTPLVGEYIGEYIAGPSSVSPASVMLKLKKILLDSNTKNIANHDYLIAIQEKEQLEKELHDTRAFRQASQSEIERIQAFNARIADYDLIMSLTSKVSQDPFLCLEALLNAQIEINKIKCTQHQGFELFIKERVNKLHAEINAVIKTIINQYDHITDSEVRYNKLLQSRKDLHYLGVEIPDELYIKIQKLRLQKAWDTTYEVHKFGDQKREFKHYFLGVPQYLGHKKQFAFSWFLYTVGCGFLFTPIKNTLKLFTEAFPKKMDAYCENNLEKIHSSDFALIGHYFFKAWWLGLRPITSPIVSLKAAWHSCDKVNNKYAAWAGRLMLSGLSLALSLAAIFTVIVVVPKVVLGLLGEAGGVVATAATAADSAILPTVPVTYANVVTALRGAADVGLDRSSSAKVAARISLYKMGKSNTVHKETVLAPSSNHDKQLPESTPPATLVNVIRKP